MRTTRTSSHAVLAAALLLTLAAPRAAVGQIVDIDETRPLRSDASVDLGAFSQSIIVERWDRNEVRITGRYDSSTR